MEEEVEAGDGLTGHGGVGEAHRPVDHRVVDLLAERLHHPGQHLAAVQGARVVHGGEQALDHQLRVDPLLDLVDRLHEQRDSAQREELALQRHHHTVRAGQRVDREQAERGLAVDQDTSYRRAERFDHPAEHLLAAHLVDELDLRGGQVDVAGQQVHPLDAGLSSTSLAVIWRSMRRL